MFELSQLFLFYGINNRLVEATVRALVADLVDEDSHCTALGTYHMRADWAALPAGRLAGVL